VVRSRLLGSRGYQAWGGEIDEAGPAASDDCEGVVWGRTEVRSMKQGQGRAAVRRV
jgi:hypothetical protein